jgi:hypothetical protein
MPLPGARTLGSVGSFTYCSRNLGSVGSDEALKCGVMSLPGARTLGSVAPSYSTPVEVFWSSVFSMSGTAKTVVFQSVNFLALEIKEWGARSMLLDKGHFNYCFGVVGLMMECVSNVRFLISCQTSIRWGVKELHLRYDSCYSF